MHPPRGALRTVNFPTAAFIFQKHYNPQLQVYCNQENIRYLSFRHSSADGNSCVPHRAAFSLSFTPNLIIPFCCDCAATPMIAQVPSAVAVLWIRKKSPAAWPRSCRSVGGCRSSSESGARLVNAATVVAVAIKVTAADRQERRSCGRFCALSRDSRNAVRAAPVSTRSK